MQVKKESRTLGFDDGAFKKGDNEVILVGVLVRGKEYVDAVMSTKVEIDGFDATQKMIQLVNNSRQKEIIKVIFLNGIACAGFNLVDIQELHEKTGKPVVVIIKNKPHPQEFRKALLNLSESAKRLQVLYKAGDIHEFKINQITTIYFQFAGCKEEKAKRFIRQSLKRSSVPECLRLAHLVASGMTLGESKKGI